MSKFKKIAEQLVATATVEVYPLIVLGRYPDDRPNVGILGLGGSPARWRNLFDKLFQTQSSKFHFDKDSGTAVLDRDLCQKVVGYLTECGMQEPAITMQKGHGRFELRKNTTNEAYHLLLVGLGEMLDYWQA